MGRQRYRSDSPRLTASGRFLAPGREGRGARGGVSSEPGPLLDAEAGQQYSISDRKNSEVRAGGL
jgi:hypothetical protein